MKNKEIFKQLWIASVDIEPAFGYDFLELIDLKEDKEVSPKYIGAWVNIIIQAVNINNTLMLLEMGLSEKKFEIKFVDKIENMYSLVENNELNVDIIKKAEWLYHSQY